MKAGKVPPDPHGRWQKEESSSFNTPEGYDDYWKNADKSPSWKKKMDLVAEKLKKEGAKFKLDREAWKEPMGPKAPPAEYEIYKGDIGDPKNDEENYKKWVAQQPWDGGELTENDEL